MPFEEGAKRRWGLRQTLEYRRVLRGQGPHESAPPRFLWNPDDAPEIAPTLSRPVCVLATIDVPVIKANTKLPGGVWLEGMDIRSPPCWNSSPN